MQMLRGEPAYGPVVLVLAAFGWTQIARITRGSVISVKNSEFVTAATALGLTRFKNLTRHVLPNALAPMIVTATVSLGVFIVAEATLSFLGIGLPAVGDELGQRHRDRAELPAGQALRAALAVRCAGDHRAELHPARRRGPRGPRPEGQEAMSVFPEAGLAGSAPADKGKGSGPPRRPAQAAARDHRPRRGVQGRGGRRPRRPAGEPHRLPRPDGGDRRRVRLRQVDHGDGGHRAAAGQRQGHRRPDPARRHGHHALHRARDGRAARRLDRPGAAGPDDQPEPGVEGRLPDHRGVEGERRRHAARPPTSAPSNCSTRPACRTRNGGSGSTRTSTPAACGSAR